ncbi:Cell wall-associated polypeptide CWBP200 [uncultured Clostridium sp.]|nr:Cell wall-associated polypeptide CWBP200 [uncultured Clostridium sp.]
MTWNGSLYQKYYYMGSALFFTTDANNLRDSENILSPGGSIVASRRQDSSDANKYYFYHTDIRGSVTNIVGTKENAIYLAQGYNYDNFGKEEALKSESSFKNDVTFTGAVSDSMTGLYYMNARHYDPDTGRFLQQDTYKGSAAVPWTQHLYVYTGNNPVNMVDPTGHYTNTASDQYANYTYDWSSKTLVPIVNYSNTMTDQYQGDYGRTTSTISKNGIQKKAVNLPKSKPRSVNDASNQYVEAGSSGVYYGSSSTLSYQPPALEYASPGMKMPAWVTGLENGIMFITGGVVLTALTGGAWVPVAIGGLKGGVIYGGVGAVLGGGTELINSGGSWDNVLPAAADGFGVMFSGGALNGTVDGMITVSMQGNSVQAYNGVCFVEGTIIATRTGDTAIEEIKVGDTVYAANAETGEEGYKKVVNTFIRETDTLITITVDREEITTTPTHPFWVEGAGWKAAGELKAGQTLRQSGGKQIRIAKVAQEQLTEPVTVYNFEVEDWHTYFVGDAGILVHNSCGGRNSIRFNGDQQAVIDLAKQAKNIGGIRADDANTLLGWANEYGVPYHGLEIHLNRSGPSSNIPHIHIGKTGHIPIK